MSQKLIKKWEKERESIINPDGLENWDEIGFDEAPKGYSSVSEWLENNEEFDEGDQARLAMIAEILDDLNKPMLHKCENPQCQEYQEVAALVMFDANLLEDMVVDSDDVSLEMAKELVKDFVDKVNRYTKDHEFRKDQYLNTGFLVSMAAKG